MSIRGFLRLETQPGDLVDLGQRRFELEVIVILQPAAERVEDLFPRTAAHGHDEGHLEALPVARVGVLEGLEFDWLTVVGVAKGRARRPGAERLFRPGSDQALRAGKPVVVDKPLTITAAEAADLRALMLRDMGGDNAWAVILDANGKPTRVGFRMEGDKKVRFAKTTGDVI